MVAVARLDRTGPSTHDLLNTLAAITCTEAGFRSLGDAWADTTIAHGPPACYQAAIRVRGAAKFIRTRCWRETDSNPRSLFMATSLVNLHLSLEAALSR